MTKTIEFAQHIRTSSKARRGFRTFKRTLSVITDQLDEKLGTYGVYTPTQYQNFQEMEPKDYPKLFMFYRLEGRRVLCKSTYEGNDLHSYPPRAGNYIAHALICNIEERFNPIEVFKKATWKTIDNIRDEDDVAGVDLSIEALRVSLQENHEDTSYLKVLLEPPHEGYNRQNMFKQAVDAIINQKKVIIVDDKEMLESWMFCLLQAFPEEFVFKSLNIASFSNSNLLMEVCNVLCFEPENVEKIRRHSDYEKWEIVTKNSARGEAPYYARVLTECIAEKDGKDFAAFKREVFKEFDSTSTFSVEEFNKHARFFDELHKIGEMSEEGFVGFLSLYIKEYAKVRVIFEEIKSKKIWKKIMVFWKALKGEKPTHNLENYKFILENYSVPGETDQLWLEFEKMVVQSRDFQNNLDTLLDYYRLTKIENPQRLTTYFPKIEQIIGLIENPEIAKARINDVFNTISSLDGQSKAKLEAQLRDIEIIQQIKDANGHEKVIVLYNNRAIFKSESIQIEIEKLIGRLSWEQVFTLIKDGKRECLQYLIEHGPPITFSNVKLVSMLIKSDYREYQADIFELYSELNDKNDFLRCSPKGIQDMIFSKIFISTVPELEKYLGLYKEMIAGEIIVKKFLDVANHSEVWLLCELCYSIQNSNHLRLSQYPNIRNISDTSRNLIFNAVNDLSVEIPERYRQLAEWLSRQKYIKRLVPKSRMEEFSYDDLRSIGAIGEFKDIRKKIKGDSLSEDDLLKLVKLPWEYFCWKELCEQLSVEENREIPNLIAQIIEKFYRSRDDFKYRMWCLLACEYITYLIKYEKSKEFRYCLDIIRINWKEYEFISNRLLVIMYGTNPLYENFKQKSKGFGLSKGPSL
ncbi:MAG: hypothetical protein CV087_19685 [Candidatus Brocadia sp. WS118]|nr:MAG: hypothetical protein CV087_19685 [Candidatus Brocadia sp. WS118]